MSEVHIEEHSSLIKTPKQLIIVVLLAFLVPQTAIKGIRNMPPRGGSPDLSDTEVGRAIAYMANQVGAGFKEPEAKPAAPAQKK